MIIGKLEECEKVESLHPDFKEVFHYIRSHGLSKLSPRRISLKEGEMWIDTAAPELRESSGADLELHREYIDIQVVLEGEETYGWEAAGDLKAERIPYDAGRDIAFYKDRPRFYFTLRPGEFVIFFPEDAHAPCIGRGQIKKLVAKIRKR